MVGLRKCDDWADRKWQPIIIRWSNDPVWIELFSEPFTLLSSGAFSCLCGSSADRLQSAVCVARLLQAWEGFQITSITFIMKKMYTEKNVISIWWDGKPGDGVFVPSVTCWRRVGGRASWSSRYANRWQHCRVISNKTQTLCVIRYNAVANCVNRQRNWFMWKRWAGRVTRVMWARSVCLWCVKREGERGGEVVGDDTLITGKQKVCRQCPLVLPVKAVAARCGGMKRVS